MQSLQYASLLLILLIALKHLYNNRIVKQMLANTILNTSIYLHQSLQLHKTLFILFKVKHFFKLDRTEFASNLMVSLGALQLFQFT